MMKRVIPALLALAMLLGLPVMVMEFAAGRAAQTSPVHLFQKLQKPKGKWGFMGWVSLVGNIALMAFYTVVTGWMMYYCFRCLRGDFSGKSMEVAVLL